MEASTRNETKRPKFIGRISLIIAAVGIATAVGIHRRGETELVEQRRSAVAMAESSEKQRAELLELYVRRIDLASRLLKSIGAPPLNPEWTKTEGWRTATAEDLAALDRYQNLISNHLAQFMSKIQIYGEPGKTKPDKTMQEVIKQAQGFERFEQDILRKRREYAELAATFTTRFQETRNRESLKNDPDFSIEKFPLFPAEIELQRSLERKASDQAKEKN